MNKINCGELEELFEAVRSGLIKAAWRIEDGAEDSLIVTPDLVNEPAEPSKYIIRVMKLPN